MKRTTLLVLALVVSLAVAALLWLVFLQPTQSIGDATRAIAESGHDQPDEAIVANFGQKQPEIKKARIAEQPSEQTQTRESLDSEFVISGTVLTPVGLATTDLAVRLIARPWRRDQAFDANASWEFANSSRTLPAISLQADGSFEFRRPLRPIDLSSLWRVQIGYQIAEELRFPEGNIIASGATQTGFLPLNHSSSFRLDEEQLHTVLTLQAQAPIEVVQEYRGFHQFPHSVVAYYIEVFNSATRSMTIEKFEDSEPYSAEAAATEIRLLMSSEQQGRALELSTSFRKGGSKMDFETKVDDLAPGVFRAPPIDVPRVGILEVRIVDLATRLAAIGSDEASLADLRIILEPWTSQSTTPKYPLASHIPATVEAKYTPNPELDLHPTASWDGSDFIVRMGWVPEGEYNLTGSLDNDDIPLIPQRTIVPAWVVTPVRANWQSNRTTVQLSATPAPEDFDEYVVDAFAIDAAGRSHSMPVGLVFVATQATVPIDTREIAVITQYTRDGQTRWSCYRAEIDGELPEHLQLRREGSVQQILLADLAREGEDYHVYELRPPNHIWGGQSIRFHAQGQAMVEVVGFPPATYQLWLGHQQINHSSPMRHGRDVTLD